MRGALLSMMLRAVLLLSAASSAQAIGIYWTSSQGVGHANLDGTGVDQTFIPVFSAGGVTVDDTYVYWTGFNTIGRANLDGTGVDLGFISGSVGYTDDVAVDGSFIYWAATASGTIGRANLDGTGVDPNFITLDNGGGWAGPIGVAVDGTHVYWTTYNPNLEVGTVGRANLDGSGVNQVFLDLYLLPGDPAVDATFIYVTATPPPWYPDQTGWISRANLDGSSGQVLISGTEGFDNVAVDATFIYWTSPGGSSGGIGRANLDGSGVNQAFIPFVGNAFDVAVSPVPEPSTGLLVIAGLLGLARWRRARA